jgi:guanylate kinase
MEKKRGLLFVISGPAGSGKSTIVKKLIGTGEFEFSVSATTRAPREGETDGVQYYFVSKKEFEEKIERGEMLEHAEYVGNYYGTPKEAVERCLAAGRNMILEIEVQGAAQVKKKMPDAVMIMIAKK